MHAQTISHMFGSFTFKKSADEIIDKATAKTAALKSKIEERKRRVADLRAEYGIDDAALVQLLQAARRQNNAMRYSYSSSMANNAGIDGAAQTEERTIGAGVVNNLMTENDFISAEGEQIDRLAFIIRNLKPIPRYADNGAEIPPDGFELSYEEMHYLGF